jgi:two-component system, OmpR family, sensor histidine kinase KdpD
MHGVELALADRGALSEVRLSEHEAPFGERAGSADELDGTVEDAGHFRIYLGAAPGVGKTFAMLNEGRRRNDRGTDVVVGFVESHGRPRTAELLEGLEVQRRLNVEYRGANFEEMDLDGLLERHPSVALVDELAHTNVPGAREHEKRWQDVLTLLEHGIDVITTVNIQHLESIADAVEQMTGVPIRERVPDRVVRMANQIELVDSSPEQLRRRMLHGNIYPPDKIAQSLTHFFRTDNLTALRELALRFLADETEEELLHYLRLRQSDVVWETTERIMVGVTGAPGTDAIVRRAARMAARLRAELHVVHVTRDEGDSRSGAETIEKLHRLAVDVGAHWHELPAGRPADALMEFARGEQITQIVLGSSQRSRWQELVGGGSIVRRISRLAGAAGIDVHMIARREHETESPGPAEH